MVGEVMLPRNRNKMPRQVLNSEVDKLGWTVPSVENISRTKNRDLEFVLPFLKTPQMTSHRFIPIGLCSSISRRVVTEMNVRH